MLVFFYLFALILEFKLDPIEHVLNVFSHCPATIGERAIVSPIAGTTRDAVDVEVERDGAKYMFIDTAGIRRKGKTKLLAEKLSVVAGRSAVDYGLAAHVWPDRLAELGPLWRAGVPDRGATHGKGDDAAVPVSA